MAFLPVLPDKRICTVALWDIGDITGYGVADQMHHQEVCVLEVRW